MRKRPRSDEDFAREVESHVQLEADRLAADGMPAGEARRAAEKRFGNVTRRREDFYYARRSEWFDGLKQDVRTAWRGIRRYPIACAIAVISLAGGIGATTTTLLLRDAIFLSPPPLYQDPGNLYAVRSPTPDSSHRAVPAGLFRVWLDDEAMGGAMAAATAPRQQDVRSGDQVVSMTVRGATPNLFAQLGVAPAMGTPLHEWPAGGDPPAVLSGSAWARLFGAREEGVIGASLLVDGQPHTVIAVMPRRFWFAAMDRATIWTRASVMALPAEALLDVVIRRPDDLPETSLREGLRAGADSFAAALPAAERQLRVSVEPVRGTPVGNNVGPFVLILLTSAVVLTLLIACTNVAVLMMAQWTSREHEIAIRASLGGARGRIIRSLLTESMLIAGIGGALGLALTFALRGLAVQRVPSADLYDLSIDPTILLQSGLVTLAVGLLTGVAPALYETRRLHVNPLNTIRGSDRVRQRWRHALVVFEIAATVALLVSTGAMLSSYSKSLNGDPGFDPHPIFAARVEHPDGLDPAAALARVRAMPGVVAAEVATSIPYLAIGPSRQVSAEASGPPLAARGGAIGPDYFTTLGVRMRSGRSFTSVDTASAEPAAIVNDVLASQLWSTSGDHGAAIGRQAYVDGRVHVVVGVVTGYAMTANQPPRPAVFTPYAQVQPPPARAQLMIRAAGEAAPLTEVVRRELAAMDGGVVVTAVWSIDQIIEIIGQEIIAGTLPLFPLIATGMLLTAAGIYGVLAFAVTRRATELAVRVAVGATQSDLVKLVAAHSVRLLGLGTTIGVALTYALTRVAQGRGGVFDSPGWQAFAVPMLLIAAIAAIATLIPMRRALRTNPSSLLRST